MGYTAVAPTAAELEPLAREHVSGELRMTLWAANSLVSTAGQAPMSPAGDPAIMRAALVEIFLLHLRNVVAFLTHNPRQDDVVAIQYSAAWAARTIGPDEAWLAERLPSINKRVAHVTAYRLRMSIADDTYYVEHAVPKLLAVWRLFLRSLNDERRDWFQAAASPPSRPGDVGPGRIAGSILDCRE